MVQISTFFVSGALLLVAVTASNAESELQSYELETQALQDAWSDQVLSTHNAVRARYGARPLQWSADLYGPTLEYAETCKFGHSDAQSKYGENLYASSDPNSSIADAVRSWTLESSKYNYNQPQFSAATGHFTQLVWKSTTQVACALSSCPAGSILPQPTKYIVCRYTPPGNFPGQFQKNVGRPV